MELITKESLKRKTKTYAVWNLIKEYIPYMVWCGVGVYVYMSCMFICIDGWSFTASRNLLLGLAAASSVAGVALTYSGWKEKIPFPGALNWMVFAVMPLGVYQCISGSPLFAGIVGIGVSITSAIYYIYTLYIDKKAHKKEFSLRRYFRVYCSILAVGSVIAMAPVAARAVNDVPRAPSAVSTNNAVEQETWKLDDHMSSVAKVMQPKAWEKLSDIEKLDVLQTVANIEQTHLGISHELNVVSQTIDDPTEQYMTFAQYQRSKHRIVINQKGLKTESGMNLIHSICHEAYHAYQYDLRSLYNQAPEEYRQMICFAAMPSYLAEWDNYQDGNVNHAEYKKQRLEQDAEEYAEDAEREYWERIAKYLEK